VRTHHFGTNCNGRDNETYGVKSYRDRESARSISAASFSIRLGNASIPSDGGTLGRAQ
jgi:hypothetical protein